jgi:hypothetical protein
MADHTAAFMFDRPAAVWAGTPTADIQSQLVTFGQGMVLNSLGYSVGTGSNTVFTETRMFVATDTDKLLDGLPSLHPAPPCQGNQTADGFAL